MIRIFSRLFFLLVCTAVIASVGTTSYQLPFWQWACIGLASSIFLLLILMEQEMIKLRKYAEKQKQAYSELSKDYHKLLLKYGILKKTHMETEAHRLAMIPIVFLVSEWCENVFDEEDLYHDLAKLERHLTALGELGVETLRIINLLPGGDLAEKLAHLKAMMKKHPKLLCADARRLLPAPGEETHKE